MHKNVMMLFGFLHVVVIGCILFHMFNVSTLETESTYCYITWPLIHLYYAFENYIVVWFCFYNACEIATKRGEYVLSTSRKFLIVMTLISFLVFPLQKLSDYNCKNWKASN